jgi:predicted acetyltransferase
MVELVRPDASRRVEWLAMADEFGRAHIDGRAMGSQTVDGLRDPTAFAAWVEMLLDHERGANVPDGMVPSTSRWIAVDGRLLGFLSVRHVLNGFLRELGGHIGYGIRPSERRQGYATAATVLALAECRRRGIDRVLITCDDTNVASATVIERNGGVLEDIRNGKRRYWSRSPRIDCARLRLWRSLTGGRVTRLARSGDHCCIVSTGPSTE